eukprot:3276511-Pleurochrysis_carterae.AAC.2
MEQLVELRRRRRAHHLARHAPHRAKLTQRQLDREKLRLQRAGRDGGDRRHELFSDHVARRGQVFAEPRERAEGARAQHGEQRRRRCLGRQERAEACAQPRQLRLQDAGGERDRRLGTQPARQVLLRAAPAVGDAVEHHCRLESGAAASDDRARLVVHRGHARARAARPEVAAEHRIGGERVAGRARRRLVGARMHH